MLLVKVSLTIKAIVLHEIEIQTLDVRLTCSQVLLHCVCKVEKYYACAVEVAFKSDMLMHGYLKMTKRFQSKYTNSSIKK